MGTGLALRGVFQSGLEVEVGDEAMEVIGMQAEKFGGLGKVALGLFEGCKDEVLFRVANGVVEIGAAFGGGQSAIRESVWEVFWKNEVRIADDDGALDGVL